MVGLTENENGFLNHKQTSSENIFLNGHDIRVQDIYEIAKNHVNVELNAETKSRIRKSREILEKIAENEPIYGVTTGYGEMVYLLVENQKETELQTNLIRSHSAGVGPHFNMEEARAIVAVRINALCRGYSAVREELVERLVYHLNQGIIPIIPEIGSLGASGDLGQLAHLALPIIGEGYVFDKITGEKVPSAKVLKLYDIQPMTLKHKEGLALINGTSAMTGLGSILLVDAKKQVKQAEIITALVLENQRASLGAFQPEGHEIGKPHQGQIDCASNLLKLFENSRLVSTHKKLKTTMLENKEIKDATKIYLQKAYTLRCSPQILGAVKDTLDHAEKVLNIEINSSNDNPLVFENKEVFHGGNFHGQPVAFVMDFMSIALTQLGVVSERRINRLLNKNLSNGLPDFLSSQPGLNCGFAGAQYPATALIAENRTICTPASIQSVPSNGDNQDVVSMGLIAARNCKRILKNNYFILAIELLCAAQAVDISNQFDDLSPAGKAAHELVRKFVPKLEADRYMADDITAVAKLLEKGKLLEEIEKIGIHLK